MNTETKIQGRYFTDILSKKTKTKYFSLKNVPGVFTVQKEYISHVVCNHPEDQATSYVKPFGRFRDGFQKDSRPLGGAAAAAGYGVTLANSV